MSSSFQRNGVSARSRIQTERESQFLLLYCALYLFAGIFRLGFMNNLLRTCEYEIALGGGGGGGERSEGSAKANWTSQETTTPGEGVCVCVSGPGQRSKSLS